MCIRDRYQPTCSFVIGIYFYVWYTTCCPKWEEALEFTYMVIGEVLVLGLLVVVYKIPYNSCMFNTVVVVACVIFIHGFFRCGYWIWVFCCLFVVCIYMFGWLYRATCSFVPDIYFNVWYITCCPKWEEALEFTYRVIGEVLVLGLLVMRFRTAVVCEPRARCNWCVPIVLLSI